MKLLILLSVFVSSLAFAGQTKTECPWMSEGSRLNPKANMSVTSVKPAIKSKSGVGQ